MFPAASLRSRATRSHVVPVARIAGSRITLPEIGQINLGGALASIAMRSNSRICVVCLLGVGGFPPTPPWPPTDRAASDCPDEPLPFLDVNDPRGVRRGDLCGELGMLLPYFSVVVTMPNLLDGVREGLPIDC